MRQSFIGKVFRKIRKHGLRATYKYSLRRLDEIFFDLRYGIKTRGYLPIPQIYQKDFNHHAYGPSRFDDFKEAMKHVALAKNRDVFLDFGSGMGRVLILASMYPFKRVIGVEINPELSNVARNNFLNLKSETKCKDISIVTSDASLYSIPNDVTVIYFNNPFKGEVLERVVSNIYKSLLEYPRPLTIIFGGPRDFERIINEAKWLQKSAEFNLKWPYVIYKSNIQELAATTQESSEESLTVKAVVSS